MGNLRTGNKRHNRAVVKAVAETKTAAASTCAPAKKAAKAA